jgi:hypothetical protein
MEQGRQFKALYSSLGFSAYEAAQLLHVTTRSVHNWVSGSVPVPYMAVKLLRLMLRYELPGKAWEGWHLSAGKLYTPEGLELAPHEVSWWSLLVRQARSFRATFAELNALKHQARLAGSCARAARTETGPGRASLPVTQQVRPIFGKNHPSVVGPTTGKHGRWNPQCGPFAVRWTAYKTNSGGAR